MEQFQELNLKPFLVSACAQMADCLLGCLPACLAGGVAWSGWRSEICRSPHWSSSFISPSVAQTVSKMSDSFQPHRLQPARLLCPWNSPGKNTGVGCHFLLQGIFLTLHQSNPSLTTSYHPPKKRHIHQQSLPIALQPQRPALATNALLSISIDFLTVDSSCKWNHTIYGLL